MKKLGQNEALTHLKYCQTYSKEDTFFGVWDETLVHYGFESEFDQEKVMEKGLRTVNLNRKGGAFVTHKGDIAYAHLTRQADRFNQSLGSFLANKLIARGLNVVFRDNDWLIDGKKFMGTMMYYLGGNFHFYGGHISINVDLDLIKNICLKPMEKEPIGLSEFGITTEQVEEWLHEFYFYWKK